MKHTLSLSLLTSCMLAITTVVCAQQAKLEGRVFDEKNRPALSIRINAPGGQAAVTDNKGNFRIYFSTFIPGRAIRIEVAKLNWVIYEPMFGNCVTQSMENYEPLRVVIVPKGSPLSYVPKRLSEFVDALQRRVNIQAKTIGAMRGRVGELERQRSRYAFLQEYTEKYGISPDAFKTALDEWARIKESDDKLESARKEYWLGHLEKVTELTKEAGPIAAQVLKEKNKQRIEAGRKVISILTLEGNAFYEQYKFREALGSFSKIEQLFEIGDISREELRAEWAGMRFLIGNAKLALGQRVQGEEAQRLLKEAVLDYQQSAAFHTRDYFPRDWALIQNNLGHALRSLGGITGGNESVKFLKDALEIHHSTLDVFTREQVPQRWAEVQVNLGSTQLSLGQRMAGTEGARYLSDAAAAYRNALEVINREQSPQYWTAAQTGLGITLSSLGERTTGAESIGYLKDASKAHRASLEVRTREQMPQEWAASEINLGVVLWNLGERVSGAEGIQYLKDAAAAYRSALEVDTREQLPQDWAKTQINLGNALKSLGERMSGVESIQYLKDASGAHRAALEVFTRKNFPQQWAIGQANLGNALFSLGIRANGAENTYYLNDATVAYHAALEVFNQVNAPRLWTIIQINLARAYYQLHNWADAVEEYRKVFTFDPDNKQAYEGMGLLYHDRLFDFDKAFLLHQQWLVRHKEDISAQADFAQAHFTTGRFNECEQRIKTFLTLPEATVSTKTALRAIEIANYLASDKSSRVHGELNLLLTEVANQSTEFKVDWVFDGTKYYIDHNEKLLPYRPWLKQLFDALKGKDRDTILKGLREVQETLKQ